MEGPVISTPVTRLLGIKHPVLLAGMNVAAGPELAAAVSNAGGLGVIGGVGWTPAVLKKQVQLTKQGLTEQKLPFGIDLLLPQVGGNARKTNYDYTGGQLPELIDIICESGSKLFVSAVGVPPRWAVDKLHKNGILVMNMIGSPKHVAKALEAGVDLLCPQGSEAGGHTGEVATSVLVPLVVDAAKGARSPMTGQPVYVIASGGIFDGRGLALALSLGAEAVWVGTRFVAATEAGASEAHKRKVVEASVHDTMRTTIYTGRPMRAFRTPFIVDWEENRHAEIRDLQSRGIIVIKHWQEQAKKGQAEPATDKDREVWPYIMGQAAGAIKDVKPAAAIINEMVADAAAILKRSVTKISAMPAKL